MPQPPCTQPSHRKPHFLFYRWSAGPPTQSLDCFQRVGARKPSAQFPSPKLRACEEPDQGLPPQSSQAQATEAPRGDLGWASGAVNGYPPSPRHPAPGSAWKPSKASRTQRPCAGGSMQKPCLCAHDRNLTCIDLCILLTMQVPPTFTQNPRHNHSPLQCTSGPPHAKAWFFQKAAKFSKSA